MKTWNFTFVALTSVLLGSAIWSCDKVKTPGERAETPSAQEQQASTTMMSAQDENAEDGNAEDGNLEQIRADCPMVVQGTDVAVADTEGGVALTFTTAAGDVADLRTSVQHMAGMYGMHRGQGGMMWHHMGGAGMGHGGMGHGDPATGGARQGPMAGPDHMAGRGPMPAASTTTTDTELGAQLELRPTDPAQLDALREHVRWHQEKMHSGECWMLAEPQKNPAS